MKLYKVVLEIALEAENPIEAAENLAEIWDGLTYIVQDDETKKIVTVDLGEPEEDAVLPLDKYEPLIS